MSESLPEPTAATPPPIYLPGRNFVVRQHCGRGVMCEQCSYRLALVLAGEFYFRPRAAREWSAKQYRDSLGTVASDWTNYEVAYFRETVLTICEGAQRHRNWQAKIEAEAATYIEPLGATPEVCSPGSDSNRTVRCLVFAAAAGASLLMLAALAVRA